MRLHAGPLLILLALSLSMPPRADAQKPALPRELAAGLSLDHLMRDMMTVESHRYDVHVTLRCEPAGAAELRLQGRLEYRVADLSITSKASRPAPPRQLSVDERWSGRAHLEGETLVVDFERSDAYRPPLALTVAWRCTPTTVERDGKATAVWSCQTSQSKTTVAGAGHSLPVYMQVPLYLAPPATRLRVEAQARGGANRRSSLDSVRYSSQKP